MGINKSFGIASNQPILDDIEVVDGNVDDIKAVTGNLPSSGKLSLIQTILDSVQADFDNFDVADATAETDRWDADYINGTEGGSADINITTSGKLNIKITPDATPSAAAYATKYRKIKGKYFSAIVDIDATFGTPATSWASVGIRISNDTFSNDNQIYMQRQCSSDGVGNRLAVGAYINTVSSGETYYTTTDAALAFKIERHNTIFRCYYSLTQSPDYVWVLFAEYEDPSGYLTDTATIYLDVYSPGNAETQTSQGDFDNFKLFYYPVDALDKLTVIDANIDAIKAKTDVLTTPSSETTGTLSYIDAGGEQTIKEVTNTKRLKLLGIWLELNNMTQDGTIKFYTKINGTDYREIIDFQKAFSVADANDFIFVSVECYVNSDFKFTYTEGADEGADRDIPYNLIYENLEA